MKNILQLFIVLKKFRDYFYEEKKSRISLRKSFKMVLNVDFKINIFELL